MCAFTPCYLVFTFHRSADILTLSLSLTDSSFHSLTKTRQLFLFSASTIHPVLITLFYSFNKHLLVNHCVVVTVQGSRDTCINKGVEKNPPTFKTYILMRKTSNKQNSIINMELIKQQFSTLDAHENHMHYFVYIIYYNKDLKNNFKQLPKTDTK